MSLLGQNNVPGHMVSIFQQAYLHRHGVEIFLQHKFFKAVAFQPFESPFSGKLAFWGLKRVCRPRYQASKDSSGLGRANGHQEAEVGWFSVSPVTPVVSGTGMKEKDTPSCPPKHPVSS